MRELWWYSLGSCRPLWRQEICSHDDGKGEDQWTKFLCSKFSRLPISRGSFHWQVLCVQMVGLLGVDILFQDVDIVWYRNPLEYFHDESEYLRWLTATLLLFGPGTHQRSQCVVPLKTTLPTESPIYKWVQQICIFFRLDGSCFQGWSHPFIWKIAMQKKVSNYFLRDAWWPTASLEILKIKMLQKRC